MPRKISTLLKISSRDLDKKGAFDGFIDIDSRLHVENELMLRATGTGIYHLTHLSNSFTYIDAIIIDVPIFDKETREKISNAFNIKERLERAFVFAAYLDNIWDNENFKNTHFIWKQKSQELRADIERIKEKIK